jgi:hypothetical protein
MPSPTPTPRTFFDGQLKPSYDAWAAQPLETWIAKTAAANADNMAERVFHHWANTDASKIFGMTSASTYREYLRNNVCADFGLVRDIHDGHKHMILDRKTRQITRADQTDIATLGYGEGGYGEGTYGGSEQIVVTLDDGSKRALSAILKNVMTMWEKQLTAMGL